MNLTPYLLLISERINAETGHRCRRASSRPTKPPLNGYCGYAADEILIPTYYIGSNMGRQHTTWISEESWERLANIEGNSVSRKIARAIKFADPDAMMVQRALMRQFATAKAILRDIAAAHSIQDWHMMDAILENNSWIWEADMDVQQ